jgi:hypothetical protein
VLPGQLLQIIARLLKLPKNLLNHLAKLGLQR